MVRGFLNISDEGILLLGFPLKLSPTEQKLLMAICERDATIEELSTLLCEGVSRQNVAVHINSINRGRAYQRQKTRDFYKRVLYAQPLYVR